MLDYTKITFNELDDTDCTDTNNEQYWVEINKQFTNADEFIQMIPDYGKIKL